MKYIYNFIFLFIAQKINVYAYIKNRYTHSLFSPAFALPSSALSPSELTLAHTATAGTDSSKPAAHLYIIIFKINTHNL